jgi:hypothetical protein
MKVAYRRPTWLTGSYHPRSCAAQSQYTFCHSHLKKYNDRLWDLEFSREKAKLKRQSLAAAATS